LWDIWVEVLNRCNFGIFDDFFLDLGGDSLSAVILIAKMHHLVPVSMPEFVQNQNIAQLAEKINKAGEVKPKVDLAMRRVKI
jgi:hypothetical protein